MALLKMQRIKKITPLLFILFSKITTFMLGPKHFSSKNQIIGGLFGIFWIGLTALLGTYRENVQNSD